jgi:hypothetical protein
MAIRGYCATSGQTPVYSPACAGKDMSHYVNFLGDPAAWMNLIERISISAGGNATRKECHEHE